MRVFEMIVAIVAIATFGGLIKNYIQLKLTTKGELTSLAERVEKLESLEKRIQALEVIATDTKQQLKQEINQL